MNIESKKAVGIHYSLKNEAGEIIDTSINAEPLIFIHGSGQIIPGLEAELLGKSKGDKFNAVIGPEDGYSLRNEAMMQEVPKSEFQDADTVQIGMQFQVETEHGPLVLIVKEILDEAFVVDGNHPLAGEILNFDVEVTEVRDATEEELKSGHIHGAGCNH